MVEPGPKTLEGVAKLDGFVHTSEETCWTVGVMMQQMNLASTTISDTQRCANVAAEHDAPRRADELTRRS